MKAKNTSLAFPNKWLLLVAFVSSLLPFAGRVNSVSNHGSQPVKTELIDSKRTSLKKTVSFVLAFKKSKYKTSSFESLSVISGISRMHSRDIAVAGEFNDPNPDDRLCCCYPKIVHLSSDEYPFLFS